MFSIDPYLALDIHRQRGERLRSEAVADALVARAGGARAGRHARKPRELWRVVTRRRAPAVP
jgi:hypothetical protein